MTYEAPIILVPYDSSWPDQFEHERGQRLQFSATPVLLLTVSTGRRALFLQTFPGFQDPPFTSRFEVYGSASLISAPLASRSTTASGSILTTV